MTKLMRVRVIESLTSEEIKQEGLEGATSFTEGDMGWALWPHFSITSFKFIPQFATVLWDNGEIAIVPTIALEGLCLKRVLFANG